MRYFFSIIVPIYRVETFLHQCIDSILSQSDPDFELILVDDGSPDGCPAICDEYAASDGRIRVIHKENGGLVSARQAGIRAAEGKYVINVDGDDWLLPEALANCRKIVEQYNVEVVSFAHTEFYETRASVIQEPVKAGIYYEQDIFRNIYPKLLMDRRMNHMCCNLCSKAIQRELLYPHQLSVNTKISYGEDLVCMLPLYQEAKSIYVSQQSIYAYRQREMSMTKVPDFFSMKRERILLEELERLDAGKIDDYQDQLNRYGLTLCFWMLMVLVKSHRKELLGQFRCDIDMPIFQNHIKNACFEGITLKMKITHYFLQRNNMKAAYMFLSFCEQLKKRN